MFDERLRKICYIPLDNRPCNLDFPKALASIAGCSLITPPNNIQLSETKTSLYHWLDETIHHTEGSVMSLEGFVFGSLIDSRLPVISLDEAKSSLERLKDILASNTSWPALAFTILMRQAPTSLCEEDINISNAIVSLSELEYNRRILNHSCEKKMGNKWEQYLKTRERNFELNRLALQLTDSETFQFLAVGIDDVTKNGLNLLEQKKLEKERAKTKELSERTLILPGADELGMALLTRFLLKKRGLLPTIGVRYSTQIGPTVTMLYEMEPLKKIIADQITCIGANLVKEGEEPDLWLYIHSPETTQKEAALVDTKEKLPESVTLWMEDLKKSLTNGVFTALADVACANGADPRLIPHLLQEVPIAKLEAFAGWNTTANAIGTAIAHGVIRWLARKLPIHPSLILSAGKAHISFLFARFLDDWLYQSILRRELNSYLTEKGLSRFQLNNVQEITTMLYERLFPIAKDLFNQHFRGKAFTVSKESVITPSSLTGLELSFPWQRTFEVNVTPQITIKSV